MAASRNIVTKVPGEPTEPEIHETTDTAVAAAADADAVEEDGVFVKRSTLDAMQAKLASLEQTLAIQGAQLSTQSQQAGAQPDAPAAAPVNASAPVLTEHGWLVPETFGSPLKRVG